MADAAGQLASRIFSLLQRRATVSLEVQNLTALAPVESSSFRSALQDELRKAGLAMTATAPPEVRLRVSISENVRGLLLIAEIFSGESRQVVMLPWSAPPASEQKPQLKITKKPIWEQAEPVLDFLLLEDGSLLLALSPTKLSSYRLVDDKWTSSAAAALNLARPAARDPRGHIENAPDGIRVYVPGTTCSGSALKLSCIPANESWRRDGMTLRWVADRNLLESDGVRGLFFSATNGLVAGADGRVRDRASELIAGTDAWGSDITGIANPCGANPVLLATRAGEGQEQLRAYEVAQGQVAPASEPLDLPGPVTALWSSEKSSQAALSEIQRQETMRLLFWAWLALSSLTLAGATRPHYGGTLTVELSEFTPEASPLIAETLVRLNDKGEVEPQLAVAWQRDADRKRWRFSLRPKVAFHDGEALTASSAAPVLLTALKKEQADIAVTAGGQTLVIQSERPLPDLLMELARQRMAIYRKTDKGAPIGTGPFHITAWDPGHRLTLASNEDYYGGRPYLDSVIVSIGAGRGSADVFDIPFGTSRRVLAERTRIWSSPVVELIALLSVNANPVAMQTLALCIDRAPMVNVLTQRKGEAAFGLLPQWLSGYSFLFALAPDPARAKAQLPALTLSYPANDSFARSIADRVALNARDAGLMIQPASNVNGNLRLMRWKIESADAAAELGRFIATFGISAAKSDSLFETERSLLEEHRVIPLMHVPQVYGIAPRVHNWEAAHKGQPFTMHLENVWVEP